jgi:hypothetical protein
MGGTAVFSGVQDFLNLQRGFWRRTLQYLKVLSLRDLAWSPGAGKFTVGKVLRHLPAAQVMPAEGAVGGTWNHGGHGPAFAGSWRTPTSGRGAS